MLIVVGEYVTVTSISKPMYELRDRAGVEGLVYSGISQSCLSVPQAVQWAQKELKGGVLASVPEGIIWRLEDTKNLESPQETLATRTGAVYFIDKGTVYVLFSHNPHPQSNIVLANAQQGYNANVSGKEFIVPFAKGRKKTLLGRMRDEAETHNMVHELPEKNLELTLDGTYATNPLIKSLTDGLGQENEAYLLTKKRSAGYLWLLKPEEVKKILANKEGKGVVRPCWLVGFDYSSIGSVNANDHFNIVSRARSVVHGARKKSC